MFAPALGRFEVTRRREGARCRVFSTLWNVWRGVAADGGYLASATIAGIELVAIAARVATDQGIVAVTGRKVVVPFIAPKRFDPVATR